MQKFILIVLTCALHAAPALAQMPAEKLALIEEQLFSGKHPEYRSCLTTLTNCHNTNDDYVPIDKHQPAIADSLAWVGHQLRTRNLVHQYKFEGCKVAIDMTDGAPAYLTWLEERDAKVFEFNRSIFTPARPKEYSANRFAGNGYYIYLRSNHRDKGTAQSPRRIMYSNDAALIDLTKINDTKSPVITDREGHLMLREAPAYRINFFKEAEGQVLGTHFANEATMFTEGPALFPNKGKVLSMFDADYFPFEHADRHRLFRIVLTPNDLEFGLKIAKAFRHIIEHCELKHNK